MTTPLDAKLRQADLMPQFLFVIAMEYLTHWLADFREYSDFNFHSHFANIKITNLCFAVNLHLFPRGELISIKLL